MARSHDDTSYSDMKHSNTWSFCPEIAEKSSPGTVTETSHSSISSKSSVLNDSNMFANTNYNNDAYINQHAYNVRAGESVMNEEKIFSNMPNVSRQNYGNAVLSLDSGHLLRVFYDENNHQLILPKNKYELFNNSQGICEVPLQSSQPNNIFSLNQEYTLKNNINSQKTTGQIPNIYNQDINQCNGQSSTSNILKEVLGNLEPMPNPTGSYSPFGQNYPLNYPDSSNLSLSQNKASVIEKTVPIKQENSPKRKENIPLADNSNKKRIVAEVKPMRPSYSDVLAKNAKNSPLETSNKIKQKNIDAKLNKNNNKIEKSSINTKNPNDENIKNEKKQPTNSLSSGSESGDVNGEDTGKQPKQNKKNKNKRNMSRKWSSVDDLTNEESITFEHSKESQFIIIENPSEKALNKEKKTEKCKSSDYSLKQEEDCKLHEEDQSEFMYPDNQNESIKIKKKKERNHYNKPGKPVPEKKKTNLSKWKRNKPGYLGVAQNYLEHWSNASWKAIVWFILLLSDICHMSAHLSFDLCTSVFTQTYVSLQAVWRSSKEWLYKIGNNKYLHYIDRKLGHTKLGFWRKIRLFRKDTETENSNDSAKLNTNIPLPATGEEAMKRLLACKGKDPYSILGVSVTCSDEEIKRYYRRQAFLVHPDKNQQPGAEEAFKILQHAFDLIGEPERREAYEQRAQESRHVEAAWSELSHLLAQLHDKMEFAANTIRCTNCGRRHKRVLTDRPCYAARYCVQCKIRHSAKEGDIWAESSMMGLLVMYYACMDGAVYQITQWASCQKKNLKQLRPDCHVVQYRIVLGNKAAAAPDLHRPSTGHDPNLEEFLNNLYTKSGVSTNAPNPKPPTDTTDVKKRRNKKPKA